MGTPRMFGLKNQTDYSINSFIKANKRCWALNPAFFITDELKIAFLSTRLAGAAEIWFSSLEDRDDPCLLDITSFMTKLQQEFATTRTEWQIRVDLHLHRQGKRTIAEYTSSFRALSNQCHYSDEALLTGYFLGLNTPVQIYLESLHMMPRTFNDIVATCLDYGSRRNIINRPPTFAAHNNNIMPPPGVPSQPMEVDVLSARTTATNNGQPRSPLSAEEKDARLKGNLCLYCGSDQHFVSNCPTKPKNH